MKSPLVIIIIALVAAVVVLPLITYTVSEEEQIILTEFGKPVGDAVKTAGLHFKMPFTQKVNRLEKRILEWNSRPSEMPTKDKLYIVVDAFARWRISDPLRYLTALRDERSALSRLDDILGSELRNAVAKHDLIELIRTTKDRVPLRDAALLEAAETVGSLSPIRLGRTVVEAEVSKNAKDKLGDFGIELLGVRFKRINYNQNVSTKIYERMVSERQQIASRFRSEGEGEAAKILGNQQRDMQQIESEAYRDVQKLRGDADAKASEIYAQAYNQGKEATEFYQFLRTMETYQKILGSGDTLILSTDSELFRYLKEITPRKLPAP
ncbi:MAG: protease modulator HflC [Verrucomicrobiota bacterium]|nr:protease modulator HflC [Verrucomicrobiota bacterium]